MCAPVVCGGLRDVPAACDVSCDVPVVCGGSRDVPVACDVSCDVPVACDVSCDLHSCVTSSFHLQTASGVSPMQMQGHQRRESRVCDGRGDVGRVGRGWVCDGRGGYVMVGVGM